MGMKRGVSLYSYQQEEWFGRMTWRDQLREVATNLSGATGVEIIDEATIPQYPYPPESFIDEWNNEIARWGLVPTVMDTFPDSLQYRRDHVMSDAELAERLKIDLRLAKKMGFKAIRILGNTIDCVKLALPLAEELDITINQEIHAPASIRRAPGVNGGKIMDILEYIEKTGTKHYGFQPDFGIFKTLPSDVYLGYYFRRAGYSDYEPLVQEVIENYKIMDDKEMREWATKTYPDVFDGAGYGRGELNRASAAAEDLKLIAPYIYAVHAKFYHMTEIPGMPGEYEELSIDYENPIRVLKEIGFEGYINSEYEGQRSQQDRGIEFLADEIKEVRLHQQMLKRMIGE